VSFLSADAVSTWKQSWYASRLFSGSLAESNWLFLLHPYDGTGADALDKLYFFIPILILALYSFILREVTKRVPF